MIVLGFDMRESIAGLGSSWTDERRSRFLIRPEISAPLSVDRAVWPSVAVNADEGYPLSLWGSVSEILSAASKTKPGAINAMTVIEIAAAPSNSDSSTYWEAVICGRVKKAEDEELEIEWRDLGYDVADRYLVSGLSNSMLPPADMLKSRNQWSLAIDSSGLFAAEDRAQAFRSACDVLIPEHAPFEVYRVRMLETDDELWKRRVTRAFTDAGGSASTPWL
jgi:hypothetical protein